MLLVLGAGCARQRVPDTVEQSRAESTVPQLVHDASEVPHDVSEAKVPEPRDLGSDDIFGREVARAESWWVDGPLMRRGEQIVRLRGLNWFGLETGDRALHGLWTGRTVTEVMRQIAALGFNALRLPVSPDAIRPGRPSHAGWGVIDDGDGDPIDTGREHLVAALATAERHGLMVLLDFHNCQADRPGAEVGRPDACPGYTLADWHADLAELARLVAPYRNVVGVDLFNEPHGLVWAEWKLLADGAARMVLQANPHILVFVQGVGGGSKTEDVVGTYWGEDLSLALSEPLAVPPSRLVFSPHVYGPGIVRQAYFDQPDFPGNLPAIWDRHFGYLRLAGRAIVIGEFGGWYDDKVAAGEEAWNRAFVGYLASWDRASFFYWALNPNSRDTGGLLGDDWKTVHPGRLELLRTLLERGARAKP